MAPHRLERLTGDRVVAGVASGIARRYDIGVGWLRLGFVVGFFFGFGVLAYILGWLLIPAEGERDAIVTRYLGKLEGASSWVGVGLIGLAVLIIAGGSGLLEGELVWAGALILVGVLLYRGDLDSGARSKSDAAEVLPPPTAPGSSRLVGEDGDGPIGAGHARSDVSDLPPPPARTAFELPPPPASAPRPAPSLLGRFTIAAILIAVGVVWILDRAETLFPGPEHYAALVLGIIGLGLLVGTWFGRSRGLIALGIVVLPFFLFLTFVDVPWTEGWGERSFRPTVVAEQPLEYRLAGGQLTIDLRDLEFARASEVAVEADLGFGELRVVVPSGVVVVADAEVVGGQINLLGSVVSGFTIDKQVSTAGFGDVLVLDLRVGFGELTVVRAGG